MTVGNFHKESGVSRAGGGDVSPFKLPALGNDGWRCGGGRLRNLIQTEHCLLD